MIAFSLAITRSRAAELSGTIVGRCRLLREDDRRPSASESESDESGVRPTEEELGGVRDMIDEPAEEDAARRWAPWAVREVCPRGIGGVCWRGEVAPSLRTFNGGVEPLIAAAAASEVDRARVTSGAVPFA